MTRKTRAAAVRRRKKSERDLESKNRLQKLLNRAAHHHIPGGQGGKMVDRGFSESPYHAAWRAIVVWKTLWI